MLPFSLFLCYHSSCWTDPFFKVISMSLKQKFDVFVPPYSRLPMISMVLVHSLAYYATKPISQKLTHYDISLPIDAAIPFIPAFSVIYVLAYIQWVAGYILITRDSRELCRRVVTGEIISKLICMALFLLYPTTMARAEIVSDGPFDTLVRYIYRMDAAENFFPSIHCLESWVCFRGAMWMKKTGRWYRYFSLLFSLLVFASTVLIKQHAAVDIIGGILTAEIGQQIARRIELKGWGNRLFKRDQSGGPL